LEFNSFLYVPNKCVGICVDVLFSCLHTPVFKWGGLKQYEEQQSLCSTHELSSRHLQQLTVADSAENENLYVKYVYICRFCKHLFN